MSETTASRMVTVANPQGLHARPADLFATAANEFESKIELIKDGQRVEAKSIMGILTLGAAQGVELCIEATGHDAQQALDVLAGLIESDFVDEETGADEETSANKETGAKEPTQETSDQDRENA